MAKQRLVCPYCKRMSGFKQVNARLFAYCDKHQMKWLIGFSNSYSVTSSETIKNDTYLWNYVYVEPSCKNYLF